MTADHYRRQIQVAVDRARGALGELQPATGSLPSGPTRRVAEVAAIPNARAYLQEGRAHVEDYLAQAAHDPVGRAEFERYLGDLRQLERRLDDVATFAGPKAGGAGADAVLPNLISD